MRKFKSTFCKLVIISSSKEINDIVFLAHPVFADFDTGCVAAGSCVEVVAHRRVTGHIKGQNKTPRENSGHGVVHLGRTQCIFTKG